MEECCYPDQIPLKDSIANRQSTEYGVEDFFILNQQACFRRRTNTLDVRFGAKVECAAKFPDKKSFVVAAILRATGGGRMALCMEDPAHWPAQRQDYQHNCLVWVCTLPSLHVVQPEEGVSPGNVSVCFVVRLTRCGKEAPGTCPLSVCREKQSRCCSPR